MAKVLEVNPPKGRKLGIISDGTAAGFRLIDRETGELISDVCYLNVTRRVEPFLEVEAKFYVLPE